MPEPACRPTVPGSRRRADDGGRRDRPVRRGSARRPVRSARIRTTSRSAAAAPCSTLAGRPATTVTGLVLTGTVERERRRPQAALPRSSPGRPSRVLDLPDGRLPAHWDAVKDALEDVGRGAAADRRPGAPGRRRAPGPPPARPAGHDGLARRADPALRDPEVGRRPRLAERLRPALRGRRRAPQGRAAQRVLSLAAATGTGGTTRCSPACCACAAWSAAPGTPRVSCPTKLRAGPRRRGPSMKPSPGSGERAFARVDRHAAAAARAGARRRAHLRPRLGPVPRGHGAGDRPRRGRPRAGRRRQLVRRVRHGPAVGHARATATRPVVEAVVGRGADGRQLQPAVRWSCAPPRSSSSRCRGPTWSSSPRTART